MVTSKMMLGSGLAERDHAILNLDQALGLLTSKKHHQGWPLKARGGSPLVYKHKQWCRPSCFPREMCKPTCRSTLYLQKTTVMSLYWLHGQQQHRRKDNTENQSWRTHGNTLRSYWRCQKTTVMEICTHFWEWQMFLRTHLHVVLFLIWQILEATEFPLPLTQGSTDWIRVLLCFFFFFLSSCLPKYLRIFQCLHRCSGLASRMWRQTGWRITDF